MARTGTNVDLGFCYLCGFVLFVDDFDQEMNITEGNEGNQGRAGSLGSLRSVGRWAVRKFGLMAE